jgi:hypothetical protein
VKIILVEFDGERIGTEIDLPIDTPQVIPRLVVTMVNEFARSTAGAAVMLLAGMTGTRPAP